MEDLAYRRMMDAYYVAERPFNGCSTDVAREIGMMDQLEAVEYVLQKFFVKSENGYSNNRCDKEIAHFHDKKEKSSKAGKASAERRFNVRSTSVGKDATSVGNIQTDVQPTNNQEPITNKKNTSAPPDGVSQKVWQDFNKTRKTKVTDTAIEGIRREAGKAGITLETALETSCERGWQSFKAEWIKGEMPQSSGGLIAGAI
jgi:uncharacterized protein YdaU (DUF1376 family)